MLNCLTDIKMLGKKTPSMQEQVMKSSVLEKTISLKKTVFMQRFCINQQTASVMSPFKETLTNFISYFDI